VCYCARHTAPLYIRGADVLALVFTRACFGGVCAQRPRRAYATELAQFHSEDYVDFLARVTPDTAHVREAHRDALRAARA
jgi:hypothetical protein